MQASERNAQEGSRRQTQMLDARASKLTALEGRIQKLEAELAAQLQELTGESQTAQPGMS